MSKATPPTYTLTLRPDPAGPDRLGREPIIRSRLLLKRCRRMHGLRCISIAGDESQGDLGGTVRPALPDEQQRNSKGDAP